MHRFAASLSLLLLLLLFSGLPVFAQSAERVALVIGNGNYAHTAALANPPNDARAVAKALTDIGFDVETGLDLKHAEMQNILRAFLTRAAKARVALFYYAGHGIQANGRNYLIPVDARLSSASDLNFGTVEMDKILASLDDPRRANIIILDACRDNPLARSFAVATRSASVGKGLAAYTALGTGSLIVYATAPGQVALDGLGRHSPFTEALVKYLRTPGLEVRQMLTRVRNDVARATADRQIPWDNSSLRGDVYLAGRDEVAGAENETNDDIVAALRDRIAELERQRTAPTGAEAAKIASLQMRLREIERQMGKRNGTRATDDTDQEFKKDVQSAAVTPPHEIKTPPPLGPDGQPPVLECDKLAAMPFDEKAVAKGARIEQIDALRAVPACREAVGHFPDSPRLKFQLARALVRNGNTDEALTLMREVADKGYAAAAVGMAYMLFNAVGVDRDPVTAAGWLEKGMKNGSARATAGLGYLHRTGEGVKKDPRKAVELFKKAVDAGDPYGMAQLAYMKATGEGTQKNEREAVQLFRRSAELGEPDGMASYGYLKVGGRGVAKDCAEGVRWIRKAADMNNPIGLGYLADIYYTGNCVARDEKEAAALWLRALGNGNPLVLAKFAKQQNLLRRSFKKQLQQLLKDAGVYDGPIDGSIGPATINAIKAMPRG